MQNLWDSRFMELAHLIGSWSKDDKRKVGCVIVSQDNRILSTGYNGFPRQLDGLSVIPAELKNVYTIHAEVNCMANLKAQLTDGVTVYVTYPPCLECSKMLKANIPIIRLVTSSLDAYSASKWYASMLEAKAFLTDSGVEYVCADSGYTG